MLATNLPRDGGVHSNSKKPLAGQRILVAEDEGLIALELERILEEFGCEVVGPLASVDEVLENAQRGRFDGALLDVNLPGMNGIDLAIVMKANHPSCHLLLVSGHERTSSLLEEAARKGHMFDILAKPIHPTLILERVKVFADFHCVTHWSRLGNVWEGVSTRNLLELAGVN